MAELWLLTERPTGEEMVAVLPHWSNAWTNAVRVPLLPTENGELQATDNELTRQPARASDAGAAPLTTRLLEIEVQPVVATEIVGEPAFVSP